MEKNFTLSDIFVTIGMLIVSAALILPALFQNRNDKIVSDLLHSKIVFETAVEKMMSDEGIESLTDIIESSTDLGNELRAYIKIQRVIHASQGNYAYKHYDDTVRIDAKNVETELGKRFDYGENVIYFINITGKTKPNSAYPNVSENQKIGDVYVDINGVAEPNKAAKDLFRFVLYNDGSLKPYGSYGFNRWASPSQVVFWSAENGCNRNGVGNFYEAEDLCTGSIFDNRMKVVYQ